MKGRGWRIQNSEFGIQKEGGGAGSNFQFSIFKGWAANVLDAAAELDGGGGGGEFGEEGEGVVGGEEGLGEVVVALGGFAQASGGHGGKR